MIIDIKALSNNLVDSISIKETLNYDDTYLKKSDIKKLDNVLVEGNISKNIADEIMVHLNIKGEMTLLNSINLKDEIIPLDIIVDDSIDEFGKIDEFSIDILDIVWQNILLEVPMKVGSSETEGNKSGNGWQLLTEDEFNNKEDSRFDKLRDLLKERS